MKKNLYYIFLFVTIGMSAQIETVYVNKDVSTHFTSNQKIDYTDISTKNVVGDMPLDNVLRIKPRKVFSDRTYITIVGEGYFIQYELLYTADPKRARKRVGINEADTFSNPNYSITSDKIKKIASTLYKQKGSIKSVKSKKYKLSIALNNVWVVDDLFFVDFSSKNSTNIKYTIDQIRYKIVDKKTNKSVTNQDIEIKPIYVYDAGKSFKTDYRNIAVFKKFTYPDDKSFSIEMAETQISGRTAYLNVPYIDFLNARTF